MILLVRFTGRGFLCKINARFIGKGELLSRMSENATILTFLSTCPLSFLKKFLGLDTLFLSDRGDLKYSPVEAGGGGSILLTGPEGRLFF